MRRELREYLPVRRGRNWVEFDGWSQREDGWWLFGGYRIWTPSLKPRWLLRSVKYYVKTRDSNVWYTLERRKEMGVKLPREIYF